MTRDEALLKLLAIEPMPRSEVIAVTGWGIDATEEALRGLIDAGQVVAYPHDGNNQFEAQVLGLPQATQEAREAARIRKAEASRRRYARSAIA